MNQRVIWSVLSIVLVGAIGTHAWGTDSTTAGAKKPPIARTAKASGKTSGPHAEKSPAAAVLAAAKNAARTHGAAAAPVKDAGAKATPVTAAAPTDAATPTTPVADSHTRDAHAPDAHATTAPATDVDAIWAELLKGNQRFVAGTPEARDLVTSRVALAAGQHPTTIVLACADSRVAPELVFDQSLGDLFVVRTAGNIADEVALGSIEYAVEHLGARVLVVLGHEHCGAVKAAASGATMPTPNLQAIVDRIAPALDHVRPFAVADQLAELGVAANVHQSAGDLIVNSPIVHEAVEHGTLTLIRAVYRLESGEVVRLAEPSASHTHASIEFEVDPSSTAMELAEQK
ncbi:MAG: carbonic anhydrase [Planctomycetes bacterium]|nr:carbonic anhydrase [Planctomycetota bacterium]